MSFWAFLMPYSGISFCGDVFLNVPFCTVGARKLFASRELVKMS